MIMRTMSFLLLACLTYVPVVAQGKFAGTHKNILGKKFVDEKSNPLLKVYAWRQGDLITDVNDGRPQFLTIYYKGNDAIVLYHAHVDGPQELYVVIDAIEFKNLPTGWEIKTAGCNEGNTEGQIIIALVKVGNKKSATVVQKAWRCNRDKLRIEQMDTKDIHCIIEDGD